MRVVSAKVQACWEGDYFGSNRRISDGNGHEVYGYQGFYGVI